MTEPVDKDGNSRATELCDLNGFTYVALEDGAVLPTQPAEITVEPVTLTAAQKLSIKSASPHVARIADRVQEMIRNDYSLEDELYLSRIGIGLARNTYTLKPGEDVLLNDFNAHVESARDWGRAERAKLGL